MPTPPRCIASITAAIISTCAVRCPRLPPVPPAHYFNGRGRLPALPSPQRRPVIIQAGLSGPGMNLAATYAELQYSTRRTLASMQQPRAALDAKLASVGRKPRDVGILWSI